MSFSSFPASPRRQPKPYSPFCKESGHSAQGCWLLKTSSSASFDPRERQARRPPAGSLPARQRGRPAPSPGACALRGLPEVARTSRRLGGRAGGPAAKVVGEPGRGRAMTPPEETFPRSRQDAALGPFQSALTAGGVFQGWSLESCGCVVQDSQAGSRPQPASPSVLRAVPGTRLCSHI